MSDLISDPRSSDQCSNIRCRHPKSYHGAEQGHGRHCAGTHMDPSDDSLPYYCDCQAFVPPASSAEPAPPTNQRIEVSITITGGDGVQRHELAGTIQMQARNAAVSGFGFPSAKTERENAFRAGHRLGVGR